MVCVDLKEINIFNSFTLEKPRSMPCPTGVVSNLDFNYNDTVVAVVSLDGFVQKYDILSGEKVGESIIDKSFRFSGVAFSRWPLSQTEIAALSQSERAKSDLHNNMIYACGSKGPSLLLRCYDNNENMRHEVSFTSLYGGTSISSVVDIIVPN